MYSPFLPSFKAKGPWFLVVTQILITPLLGDDHLSNRPNVNHFICLELIQSVIVLPYKSTISFSPLVQLNSYLCCLIEIEELFYTLLWLISFDWKSCLPSSQGFTKLSQLCIISHVPLTNATMILGMWFTHQALLLM